MSENLTTQASVAACPKPTRRRRRWRRVAAVLLVLLLLSAGIAAAIPYVLAPALCRWGLRAFLADYWNGPVEIERVEFSFTGPTVLRRVSLWDTAGRNWVRAESVTFRLKDWPSLHPKLYEIEIDSPVVTAYVDDERMNLPFRRPSESSAGDSRASDYVQMERVGVNDIRLAIVSGDGPSVRGRIAPPEIGVLNNLRLVGTAVGGGDVVVRFGERIDTQASGQLRLNLSRLAIQDLRRLVGASVLEGVTLQPLELRDVRAASITYRDGVLEAPDIRARADGGRLVASDLRVTLQPGRPVEYQADLRVQDLPLKELYAAFDPTSDVRYGRASGILDDIRGVGDDLDRLEMDGLVFLDDSDLDKVTVIHEIFSFMGIDPGQLAKGSDVRSLFRLRDGVVTFAQSRLGNSLAAVDVESGGTADLRTHKIDLHMVGAMLSDLSKIPVLGWAAAASGKFTRLRIVGSWDRPMLLPEPLHNLAGGTKAFFQAVLRTGGHLTGLGGGE
jgi:hypothetical protein